METPQNSALWDVEFTSKAVKQVRKLPVQIYENFYTLLRELKIEGPMQFEWHHFGKLEGKTDVFHCHLNKGKPRYVAVWKVVARQVKIMEILYAGTHENADYRRIG